MTSSSLALPQPVPWRAGRAFMERYAPIATTVLALVAIWYVAAVAMNWGIVRDGFEREETPYTITDVIHCDFPPDRSLEFRETPEFLKIAQRVRNGLRAGHSYDE